MNDAPSIQTPLSNTHRWPPPPASSPAAAAWRAWRGEATGCDGVERVVVCEGSDLTAALALRARLPFYPNYI